MPRNLDRRRHDHPGCRNWAMPDILSRWSAFVNYSHNYGAVRTAPPTFGGKQLPVHAATTEEVNLSFESTG